MFVEMPSGEQFKVLIRDWRGAWIIPSDGKHLPYWISLEAFREAKRIPSPEGYVSGLLEERSVAARERYELIEPILKDETCITDVYHRREVIRKIAQEKKTTVERIRGLYCMYLATGQLTKKKPRERKVKKEFDDAIRKHYFTAKRNSLRTAYELMILDNYTNKYGELEKKIPTWSSFYYYYQLHWSKTAQKEIARDGLTHYQRNGRMLYGSAMAYRQSVGSYQIDETIGDIFLVSKFDRSKVIGRPHIYLAVDTCTQLIAGVYVGLESGESAVLACISNVVADKVKYCTSLGISIKKEDWPSAGMPAELITDKGAEFAGKRLTELCVRYGMEINTLPPFRAEEKPLVERMIGLLQDSYKSMLQGKGIIGTDAAERWAVDYRKQAVLTLEEYTQIIVHCIVNLNRGRLLKETGHLPVEAPKTPAKLWEWFCEQGKCSLLDVDPHEVYLRSLPRTVANVTRKGISFNRMRYLPPKGVLLQPGDKVEIAYDRQNTEQVYLMDEKKSIAVCPLAPSYAKYDGYIAEDIQVIREAERAAGQELRRAELEDRIDMRRKILQVLAGAEERSVADKDLTGIAANREQERSKLT